jgi:hypothetical protein
LLEALELFLGNRDMDGDLGRPASVERLAYLLEGELAVAQRSLAMSISRGPASSSSRSSRSKHHRPALNLTDLSLARIAAAADRIDPAFLDTPQFVSEALSQAVQREVVVNNETLTPIGCWSSMGFVQRSRRAPAR